MPTLQMKMYAQCKSSVCSIKSNVCSIQIKLYAHITDENVCPLTDENACLMQIKCMLNTNQLMPITSVLRTLQHNEAEILFLDSFITEVCLLRHQHIRMRGEHTRGYHPFQHLKQTHTWNLTPQQPTILSPSGVLSACLHTVGKVYCLPTL
jgi:hypothetical protein